MQTVKQYNAVFERAKKRLMRSSEGLTMKELEEIAKSMPMSYQSVYNYTRRGNGENLKTTLQIMEAILKYKSEKK